MIENSASGLGALLNKIHWRKIRNWLRSRDGEAYSDERFVIAVAELEDDDRAGTQRKHVLRSLQSFFGGLTEDSPVEIADFGKQLKIREVGASRERFEEAMKKGRDLIQEKNIDILIYGAVAGHNKVLALRFLVPATTTDQSHTSFQLDEKLELQADFNTQATAALAAKIMAITSRFYKGGKYIVPIATPIADKIGRLLRTL
ncbi:MAG: hypothetical protein V3U82_04685, partial [Robiginitomaculum sp.]